MTEKTDAFKLIDKLISNIETHFKNQDKLQQMLVSVVSEMSDDDKGAFFLELGDRTVDNQDIFEMVVDHLIKESKDISNFLERHDEKARGVKND